MKHISFITIVLILLSSNPKPAKADLFGGDVAILSQILIQTIQQLAVLKQVLGTGADSLNLMKDINKGINDSLHLLKTIAPNMHPGLYKDWENVNSAIQKLEAIYGTVIPSPNSQIERDADQSIAEA